MSKQQRDAILRAINEFNGSALFLLSTSAGTRMLRKMRELGFVSYGGAVTAAGKSAVSA